MNIEATCVRCLEKIEGKAALLYGAPLPIKYDREGDADLVPKRHLCIRCHALIVASFSTSRGEKPSRLEEWATGEGAAVSSGFVFSFDVSPRGISSVGLICFYDDEGKTTVLASFDIPPEIAKKLPGDGIASIPLK